MNTDILIGVFLGFSAGLLTALIIGIIALFPEIKLLKTRNDPKDTK